MPSQTEENYLKAIYHLSEITEGTISTKAISNEIKTSAASVTDMLKRLSEKSFVNYEKYKGVSLTDTGRAISTGLIRRHRLWEVFLSEKLQFEWQEVHDLAEELEHIKSDKLVRQLDAFLGFPKYDPHGNPIPDENGCFTHRKKVLLSAMETGQSGVLIGVQEDSKSFLQYLNRVNLKLGAEIELLEKFDYDNSIRISIQPDLEVVVSHKVSQNLFIKQN